jgi:hypothetical protein
MIPKPATKSTTAAKPAPITAEVIEAWALKNKPEAKALGTFIIANMKTTPEQLAKLPSRGEFEDRAVAWATEHRAEAQALVLRLLPKILY